LSNSHSNGNGARRRSDGDSQIRKRSINGSSETLGSSSMRTQAHLVSESNSRRSIGCMRMAKKSGPLENSPIDAAQIPALGYRYISTWASTHAEPRACMRGRISQADAPRPTQPRNTRPDFAGSQVDAGIDTLPGTRLRRVLSQRTKDRSAQNVLRDWSESDSQLLRPSPHGDPKQNDGQPARQFDYVLALPARF
jgi:hypothetical protein